ncbi:DUF3572 domain-containing protein [Kordiimonas marina]|uniref:DUF3572 domain-containing protein n=1 Tax=Kordiimonas marina TaxID=2872312 RepID=UPI001FF36ED5|nr:DUF3572 domain-containing protein [Kordiimonas marina]MCJ9429232.1 DUF3572 domain-containing protein [Kordiimonas marina]
MISEQAQSLALSAVVFILAEDALKDRFLALTGLDGDSLRARIGDRDFLLSTLDFLMGHEPDLLAFAAHVDEKPETVIAAWRALGGGISGDEWQTW